MDSRLKTSDVVHVCHFTEEKIEVQEEADHWSHSDEDLSSTDVCGEARGENPRVIYFSRP